MDANSTELPAEVIKASQAVDRAMTRLIRLLASPDAAVRDGALAALDGLGVAAIGVLTIGLNTAGNAEYRVRLAEALGALAPLSRTAVLLALAGAALDKSPEVRLAAARVIWSLGPQGGAPPARGTQEA